jgi:formylglycine-generating enzyme required for sulfatase activity
MSEPLARRRLWCDGFAIDRTPVTNRAWAAFLDRRVAAGQEAEAVALVPRSAAGEPCYGRAPDGTFTLPGPPFWGPDHPVVRISVEQAEAYAAAHGRRLPMDLEWEKAARGVDERPYPWGDRIERGWAALQSTTGTFPVGAHPLDVSPYGMVDASGNVADWTAESPGPDELDGERIRTRPRSPAGARRRLRGGLWNFGLYFGRVDLRRFHEGPSDGTGLRTCRSWPPRKEPG